MIFFHLPIVPPKATNQNAGKRIVVMQGKPMFFKNRKAQGAENHLTLLCAANVPPAPLDGPLALRIAFTWPWRKGEPQWRVAHGSAWHTSKPDGSTAYYQPRARKARPVDEGMAARIKQLHQSEPACGVRGTWSRLRFRDGHPVNIKKVHRIMKLKGWTLPKRRAGSRPRVKVSSSITPEPSQRWATDLALIHCGRDGWCVFVPVIDCCSREVLGHALERTGRAKTAERALEEALLSRFGALRSAPPGMLLRHDNGLVFGSRQFRAVVRDYGIQQEYITPYTPQQNGLFERFIKTFKEEFCWSNRFASIEHARLKLKAWNHAYNHERPHQSLNYKTPNQYHQTKCNNAA